MKLLVLIVISIFNLAACVKVANSPQESSPEEQTLQAEAATESVSSSTRIRVPQVIAHSEPNHYQVLLPIDQQVQAINRFVKGDESQVFAVPLKMQNGFLNDDQVTPGKTYIYEAGLQRDGEFEIFQVFEIYVPQDLLITEEIIVTKDETWTQFARIFLAGSGAITTQGHNLIIQAEEFISENGLIRTFHTTSKAPEGQPGKHGGNIKIDLQRARGVVRAEMRGQPGASGKKGADFPIFTGGLPQGGGAGIGFSKAGERGQPGGNGYAGGNSGSLQITISGAHELSLLPVLEPGLGGAGGAGGSGQPAYEPGGITVGYPGEKGSDGPMGFRDPVCLNDPSGKHCWN